MWHVSPMTHCNIITLLSESKPLELGLMQRFCKFGKNTSRKGQNLLNQLVILPFMSQGLHMV